VSPRVRLAWTAPRTRDGCLRPGEHAEQLALPFAVFRGSVSQSPALDILDACCAGLDVHKETVVATVRRRLDQSKVRQQTRTHATRTEQLLESADWLEAAGVAHLARESTGVYPGLRTVRHYRRIISLE